MEITEKYELPNDYTIMLSVAYKKQNVSMPEFSNLTVMIEGNLNKAMARETLAGSCYDANGRKEVEENDVIAWSAYHTSQKTLLILYFLLSHSSCRYFMKRLLLQ